MGQFLKDYDNIFENPLVEYIPLQIMSSNFRQYQDPLAPRLSIYQTQQEVQPLLSHYHIDDFAIQEGQLAILVTNIRIDLIRYRGHEVIMVGQEQANSLHLFKVTSEYFYKDQLAFLVYNREGERRYFSRLELP
ncbi:MAG: hypothetical protein UMV23_02695 [Halanaerobium sp.]|nr:hypothetical protein [Halanaerobium sp.]